MNNRSKNILAMFLFTISLLFMIAANNMNQVNLATDDCYHCGSVSACQNGGQAYGWTSCDYDPDANPPDNCLVHGAGCGTEPGEN